MKANPIHLINFIGAIQLEDDNILTGINIISINLDKIHNIFISRLPQYKNPTTDLLLKNKDKFINILIQNKIDSKESWNVHIVKDLWGDEILTCSIKYHIANTIDKKIDNLINNLYIQTDPK
ncbi:MAG: hypothetical protein AABY32_01765 [Nanoarchaeota archaeon]